MLEHHVVDHRDIQDREGSHESDHDSVEKVFIPPHVVHPLREVFLGVRLHTEETSAHLHHFPRQEQREPRHAYEGGRARPEHRVAATVAGVAPCGQVAVAPAEHDEGE